LYITHTMHIITINTSKKYALNKIKFITGIKLLRVFAPGCHLQEVLEQRNTV
jgi:hypothetical protein